MTASADPEHEQDDEGVRPPDPDPAEEASSRSDKPGAGPDGTVPGAATTGAGGAERARDGGD